MYTFLELHSTSEPVLAKDAKPIDLGYEIVRDVKTHKSLIDDGFRDSGLLVMYTRATDPAKNMPEEWSEEIIEELKKIVILKGVVVECSSNGKIY